MMFIVKGSVYPYDIMVYFGDKKKLQKILRGYNLQIDGVEMTVGKCMMFPTNQTLIWLKEEPKSTEDLAVLQHEIFHAAFMILEDIGVKYCTESDEAFAYLIQFITNEVYHELNMFKS